MKVTRSHWFTNKRKSLLRTHLHGGILNSKLECVNHCNYKKETILLTKTGTAPLVYKHKKIFAQNASAWRHSKFQARVRKTLQIPLKTVSEMKNQMTPLVYKQKKVLAYNSSAWRHSKFQSGVRKPLQIKEKHSIVG